MRLQGYSGQPNDMPQHGAEAESAPITGASHSPPVPSSQEHQPIKLLPQPPATANLQAWAAAGGRAFHG